MSPRLRGYVSTRPGAFTRLVHDHYFEATPTGTRTRDVFEFAAPWGPVGRLVETLVLTRCLRRFPEERARLLKQMAESGDGYRFVTAEPRP